MSDFPDNTRWRPVRGGLINLFKYEDQVFRYENGRLLLRGDNGSGKSRVLALQLPFLLDGEISPYRVEPDRDPAKRMEWHLLMDRHDRRRGYTWMEFGRREDGAERYLTIGCGMEAQKGAGAPKRWFFVTTERVGEDFALSRERVPLDKRQLAGVFEERGAGKIFERSGEYRAEIDRHLFHLGARYEPLIELLLQLRQPQLMRDMKEDRLSGALSEALPPVGESLLMEVAESFQSLDSDRQSYEANREMLESVELFRDGYRQYLAVAVRQLAGVLRSGQSRYESAARELRELDERIEANEVAFKEHQVVERVAATRRAAAEQQAATLRDSPEMRGKRDLDEALKRAEECEGDAKLAGRDHEQAEKDQLLRKAEREEAEALQRRKSEEVAVLHRVLQLDHEFIAGKVAFFDWERDEVDGTRARIGMWLDKLRRDIAHLEKINDELLELELRLREERNRAEDRRGEVEDAAEKLQESEADLAALLDQFAEAFFTWEESLVVLRAEAFPRGVDRMPALEDWLDGRGGSSPIDMALAAAREQVGQEIADARSRLESDKAGLVEERDRVSEEKRDLVDGRQPEPITPPTRGVRPADRPGAPFWKLCDFHEGVPAAERAGWEAALQASGLLDAWVFPDGRMAVSIEADDFLFAASESALEHSASLAAVLKADHESVRAVLERIGNHQGVGACWVSKEGRWANGPHAGHWMKEEAEFLGHAAREEARLRRIAALELELEALSKKLEEVDSKIGEIDSNRARLKAECESMPAVAPLAAQAADADQQRLRLAETRRRLSDAEGRMAKADALVRECVEKRRADAADFGLSNFVEPDALRGFAGRVADFSRKAADFWPRWEHLGESLAELERARQREARAEELRRERHELEGQKMKMAAEARARADTLNEAIGASAQAIMERVRMADEAARSEKQAQADAAERAKRCEIEAAALTEKQREAGEKRGASERERDEAVGRMEQFVERGLFAELDPALQPERAAFSTSSAVDLARRLEQELREHAADEDRWNSLQTNLDSTFGELSDQLGRHSLLPRLEYIDGGRVRVITCEFQGSARSLRDLSAVLTAELAERKRIFDERERAVIENHLIGEAAGELQQKVRGGEDSVKRMNVELAKATTSSGIQLKFSWEEADSGDERFRAVRRLFLKAGATWSQAERDEIGGFLQERIRAAREADDTLSWREHLGQALDYRAWHQFVIYRRQGREDGWKRLTRRTFGTGSGGEKALTLTVPQFAAAAAHYASAGPYAPRLILLDEAFVAIDSATRGRLMGLLETFDLDYVMTSEREWGTYPEVSGLAIYQLASRPGFDAVAVTRWVWNGSDLERDLSANEENTAHV